MIPMFALALGFSINLITVVHAGVSGLALGLAVVVVTGAVLVSLDRVTGGSGLAGMAAASTAGNAAAVPVAVAAAYAGYRSIAAAATVQVAAAVVVTAILVPIITAWYARTVHEARHPAGSAPAGSKAA